MIPGVLVITYISSGARKKPRCCVIKLGVYLLHCIKNRGGLALVGRYTCNFVLMFISIHKKPTGIVLGRSVCVCMWMLTVEVAREEQTAAGLAAGVIIVCEGLCKLY